MPGFYPMYHKMGHDVVRRDESSIHSENGIDKGNNINLEYEMSTQMNIKKV